MFGCYADPEKFPSPYDETDPDTRISPSTAFSYWGECYGQPHWGRWAPSCRAQAGLPCAGDPEPHFPPGIAFAPGGRQRVGFCGRPSVSAGSLCVLGGGASSSVPTIPRNQSGLLKCPGMILTVGPTDPGFWTRINP